MVTLSKKKLLVEVAGVLTKEEEYHLLIDTAQALLDRLTQYAATVKQ